MFTSHSHNMHSASLLLFECEQKRKKLRRIVTAIIDTLDSELPLGLEHTKDGGFLTRRALINRPTQELLSNRALDHYLSGEIGAIDEDCRELLAAIEHGRWDECEEHMDTLVARLRDALPEQAAFWNQLDERCESFQDCLDNLQAVDFGSIWAPKQPELLTPEQFIFVDRKIAEHILSHPQTLYSVDPRFFEELIASIYADIGYHIILTKRTRDGGRDIIALGQKDYLSLRLIIECKRYARTRKVSVAQVRALFGVQQHERATKALLATTSSFSQPAKEFAKQNIWQLQLLDYTDLLLMIRKYARQRTSLRCHVPALDHLTVSNTGWRSVAVKRGVSL